MFSVNILRKFFLIVLFTFFLSVGTNADTESNEIKKINEQLNAIKNLFNTGVLDEDSYNSAKTRLDQKKAKLLAVKNNSKKDSNTGSKTLEKQIQVLEKLYKDGTLTQEEFLKTKKFLTDKEAQGENIDLNELKSDPVPKASYVLNVQKNAGNKNWEKAEIIFGNYRIYTHRPGGIKVVRISDQKQLVRITDNYKIKYSNNGQNVIRIEKTQYKPKKINETISELEDHLKKTTKQILSILKNPLKKQKKELFDTDSHKLELFIDNKRVLHYVGRRVHKHHAFFYQVLTDRAEPFHFYIRIDAKAAIALNMEYFTAKIDRAVRKAKKEIALEYNVSEEQIQKIIDEKVGEETDKAVQREMENAINESVKEAIKESIGQALSAMLVSAVEQATGEAIDSAIESELASAIDQEIARAVAMGIDEAAVSAGWEAYFEVLAQGGTYEEANAAAYKACGSACDNY
jgi:uncharacterized membrane protein